MSSNTNNSSSLDPEKLKALTNKRGSVLNQFLSETRKSIDELPPASGGEEKRSSAADWADAGVSGPVNGSALPPPSSTSQMRKSISALLGANIKTDAPGTTMNKGTTKRQSISAKKSSKEPGGEKPVSKDSDGTTRKRRKSSLKVGGRGDGPRRSSATAALLAGLQSGGSPGADGGGNSVLTTATARAEEERKKAEAEAERKRLAQEEEKLREKGFRFLARINRGLEVLRVAPAGPKSDNNTIARLMAKLLQVPVEHLFNPPPPELSHDEIAAAALVLQDDDSKKPKRPKAKLVKAEHSQAHKQKAAVVEDLEE